MGQSNGKFIISLDFEKYWGVPEIKNVEPYLRSHISQVDNIVRETINLFDKYNVKSTFATVGFLFCKDINQLKEYKDTRVPYINSDFDPYLRLEDLDIDVKNLVGGESLEYLKNSLNHELASHTFSHYYCLEKGQTKADFENDLKQFNLLAKNHLPKSLVFPRNQVNTDYFYIIKEAGIQVLRVNNETSYLYNYKSNAIYIRILRLIDRYVAISGHNPSKSEKKGGLVLNSASRFFAPYLGKLSFLESFKIRRIKNEMTKCAKRNEDYHLWWHPHNFGDKFMFSQLEEILRHYKYLNKKYNFESIKMKDLYDY